ncbi:hypothetical protein GCM10017778_54340 [Streptomyces vinaceus]|nr:hypothetical protein GCM10017778_54340 [Streptomyces vinaceus]
MAADAAVPPSRVRVNPRNAAAAAAAGRTYMCVLLGSGALFLRQTRADWQTLRRCTTRVTFTAIMRSKITAPPPNYDKRTRKEDVRAVGRTLRAHPAGAPPTRAAA